MGEDVLDRAGVAPVGDDRRRFVQRSVAPFSGRQAEHAAEQAPVRAADEADAALSVAEHPDDPLSVRLGGLLRLDGIALRLARGAPGAVIA